MPDCVVLLSRYNHRIKTYMRDVNRIKKASSDTSGKLNCFNRAVDSFWPDRSALMKTSLLDVPDCQDSDTLRSSSGYEKILSFRQLATGVICIWQECWILLQTVRSKTVGHLPYIGQMTESLDKLKTDLIREIDERCYRQVVQRVLSLQSIYIHLQARRMRTFINSRQLVEILVSICCSNPFIRYTSVEDLQTVNARLKNNFLLHQRDNIDDFLLHLDQYFQPKMKDCLAKKTWLICERGWSAAAAVK